MRLNRLRGTVADRPIDSHVVQSEPMTGSAMDRIVGMRPYIEPVQIRRRADYDKG